MTPVYSRDLVEALLTAMWNHSVLADDLAPDAGMPRAKANPSHMGNLIVSMIDISRAWDRTKINWNARQAVCMRYGFGLTDAEVGRQQQVATSTAQSRIDRSVSALQANINGHEFEDAYGEED